MITNRWTLPSGHAHYIVHTTNLVDHQLWGVYHEDAHLVLFPVAFDKLQTICNLPCGTNMSVWF